MLAQLHYKQPVPRYGFECIVAVEQQIPAPDSFDTASITRQGQAGPAHWR